MAPPAIAVPALLRGPGFLWIAPLLSTLPTNTVAGSVFTDSWPGAWLPLGATEDGSEFANATKVETITPAEFFDPVAYVTTERQSSIAFALMNNSLTNYRRAMNGGVAALTPTSGTGATALYTLEPTVPGQETKCMIGWESQDSTMRLVGYQCFQGGEVKENFKKDPVAAVIPCVFNFEANTTSAKPWIKWSAGSARG